MNKILDGMKEALAVASGEEPAASILLNGQRYYPESEILRLRSDNARLLQLQEFVVRWAWREDPPNSNHKLTDAERLSAIKWYPSIRARLYQDGGGEK